MQCEPFDSHILEEHGHSWRLARLLCTQDSVLKVEQNGDFFFYITWSKEKFIYRSIL